MDNYREKKSQVIDIPVGIDFSTVVTETVEEPEENEEAKEEVKGSAGETKEDAKQNSKNEEMKEDFELSNDIEQNDSCKTEIEKEKSETPKKLERRDTLTNKLEKSGSHFDLKNMKRVQSVDSGIGEETRPEMEEITQLPNIFPKTKPKLQRTNTSKVEMQIARGSKPKLARKNTSIGELGGIIESQEAQFPLSERIELGLDSEMIRSQSPCGQQTTDKSNRKGISVLPELVQRNTCNTEIEIEGITTIKENSKEENSKGMDQKEPKVGRKPVLRRRNTSRIEMELTLPPKPKLERRNTSILELKCIDIHRSKFNRANRCDLEFSSEREEEKCLTEDNQETGETGLPEFRETPEFERPKLLRRNSSKIEMEITRPPKAKLERRDTSIAEIQCLDKSTSRSKWKGKMGKLGKLGMIGEGGSTLSEEQGAEDGEKRELLEPWLPVLAMRKLLRQVNIYLFIKYCITLHFCVTKIS